MFLLWIVPIWSIAFEEPQFGPWRYRSGDQAEWARFDEGEWETGVNPALTHDQLPQTGFESVAWFKLDYFLPATMADTDLALVFGCAGAAEIYQNGELIHVWGQLAPDVITRNNANLPEPLIFRPEFGEKGVLAIRFANPHAKKAWREGVAAGFTLYITSWDQAMADYKRQVRQHSVIQWLFTGLALAVAVLHFVLYLYYLPQRSNAYFALFALAMAALGYLPLQLRFETDAWLLESYNTAAKIAILTLGISAILFFYEFSSQPLPRRIKIYVATACVLAALSPWLTTSMIMPLLLIALLEIGLVLRFEFRRKRPGLMLIVLGWNIFIISLVFVILAHIDVITDTHFSLPLIYGSSSLLLLFFMSLFIASEFAGMHKGRIARLAAETANRAKGTFLAQMSHELRTPLNGILGMTQMLIQSKPSNTQERDILSIEQSGRHLLSLIDEILDYSKLDMANIKLNACLIEWEPFMDEIDRFLSMPAKAKGLSYERVTIGNPPQRVIADHTRLRQILLNLGMNAIKFTSQGDIRVQLTYGAPLDGHIEIGFEVSDTGRGIPPDELEHVFLPFHQVTPESQTQNEGTGLGLAICRNLCRLMGSEIGVESEVGKGSRFHFSVRFAIDEGIQPQPAATNLLISQLPRELLKRLSDACASGRILGVRECIAAMEQLNPDLNPLTTRFKLYADSFDLAGLRKLVDETQENFS